jgi:MoaA/NifB/PqqE/SkfB family radical SAM enzyme
LKTGLDHLLVIFQPGKENAWGGLSTSLAEDLFVALHITMTPQTAPTTPELLKWLAAQGVKAVSLSISDKSLEESLVSARNQAAALGLSLVWDLPVPYSAFNPVALETQVDAVPSGAGRAWLYVEPDGDVLPAQGMTQYLGNLLRDPWEQVWSKANESLI